MSARISSIWSIIWRAWKRSASPGGVSSTPRAVRWRSVTPNWSSSWAMRRLAAASAMWLAAAAFVMLRDSATRMKRASEVRSGRMSGEEAAGRDGAAMVARPRKRLVLERARDRLGAERPPEEAARAQPGEGVGAILGARAHDGEAIRHRRPEARPPRERRGIEAGGEAGHH